MSRSRLTEKIENNGVVLKIGGTEIECKDHKEAVEKFKAMGVGQAVVISADGNSYNITHDSLKDNQ